MARLSVLAFSAPLLLIGAAWPADKPGPYGPDPLEQAEAPVTYPPCRPGPGDDRCIQLYERGVPAAYAQWLRAHDVGDRRTEVAMGGPHEPAADATRHRDLEGHHRRHDGHGGQHDGHDRRHDEHDRGCLADGGGERG